MSLDGKARSFGTPQDSGEIEKETMAAAEKEMSEAFRRRAHDAFMMDMENYILRQWDSRQGVPTGPKRYLNEEWAKLVKSNLEFSDTNWDEYVSWVSNGGGDEWFQE